MSHKTTDRHAPAPHASDPLEDLVRATIEAANEMRRGNRGTDEVVLTDFETAELVRRVSRRLGVSNAYGLLTLAKRSIDTVDFETVFSALTIAASQAKTENQESGLPISGR